jgi:hypothetical protein
MAKQIMEVTVTTGRKGRKALGLVDCKKCDGTGKRTRYSWETELETCRDCDGVGSFPPVDEQAIRDSLKSRKGAVRSTPPFGTTMETLHQRRCYYVWRMARFHGGVDMTMPMVASLWCGDDPMIDALNKLTDALAREAFGTDLQAARTWGRALGYR